MIGAVGYKIQGQCEARIYLAGTYNRIDWESGSTSELGEQFINYALKDDASTACSVVIATGPDGSKVLRLIETKRYIVRLVNGEAEGITLPRFQNETNKYVKCDRDQNTAEFQFINYLGRSRMLFDHTGGTSQLQFEVVPDKMDYEEDYIALTESLAEICSAMLLEYSGATSNTFVQSDDEQRTLLEQFIFLRQFCYGQNLRSLIESIKRNPDRILDHEEEFKPFGCGRPSDRFYTNPFAYCREWMQIAGGDTYLPQTIAVTRKFDSLDTPANRFIKYALHRFDEVCEGLIETLGKADGAKQAECYNEALIIHDTLDDIFSDRFFDEIGPLDIMPQNNQVLQKREGYSQIFHAYGMLDMALQLDWKGMDEIYEGESKNIALLYEYWLFFELFKIIKSMDGTEVLNSSDESFLKLEKGITISLKQGQQSCQSFIISRYGMKVNLYYNRTFDPATFRTTKYEGSYSRPFRPDYTLAIFPASYDKGKGNGEIGAIKDGAVSYLHFDAKYRITDLTSIVGSKETKEAELEEDKVGSITNTYKRGDLLKMHTYNDAIRRTIGSYVLYPGSFGSNSESNATFCLYDEILPGVGAFAIKPSIERQGEDELRRFILSVIESESAANSRLNRLKYYSDIIVKEPPINGGQTIDVPSSNDMKDGDACVIGYIRNDDSADYYPFLRDHGLLKNGREFLFYFYAIKGTDVYSHHKDIFKATWFRFYTNDILATDSYKVEPALCRINSNKLVSKADLVKELNDHGYETGEDRHHADFYYVLSVQVINDAFGDDQYRISDINQQNGNDTFSPHSPKVVVYKK